MHSSLRHLSFNMTTSIFMRAAELTLMATSLNSISTGFSSEPSHAISFYFDKLLNIFNIFVLLRRRILFGANADQNLEHPLSSSAAVTLNFDKKLAS